MNIWPIARYQWMCGHVTVHKRMIQAGEAGRDQCFGSADGQGLKQ